MKTYFEDKPKLSQGSYSGVIQDKLPIVCGARGVNSWVREVPINDG